MVGEGVLPTHEEATETSISVDVCPLATAELSICLREGPSRRLESQRVGIGEALTGESQGEGLLSACV